MEDIYLLTISETLLEREETGAIRELEDTCQLIAYRSNASAMESLEHYRANPVYDGCFDNDYEDWHVTQYNDIYDDGLYEGFQKTFESGNKKVIYHVTVEFVPLVD